jgi:chemotaxis signal transduction protein
MKTDLLLFRVGRELFATDLGAVEEAIDLTAVTQIPGSAGPVRAIFTLRGALVPIFSPAGPLGVAPGDAATALVVRDRGGRVAIATDDVEDVLSLHDADLRPILAGATRDAGVVRGVVRRGADLITVVDLDALIAACRGAPHPETA